MKKLGGIKNDNTSRISKTAKLLSGDFNCLYVYRYQTQQSHGNDNSVHEEYLFKTESCIIREMVCVAAI